MSFEGLPGLVETREAFGETTVVVDPARIVEACTSLRDEHGFDMLVDIAATDYLGWGSPGVSGYIGTAQGRNLNRPMTQGLQALPAPKPKRFSLNYHLLAIRPGAARVGCRSGSTTESRCRASSRLARSGLVRARGVGHDGHPARRPSHPERLLMDEDWEGHPLRKDYPLGGEPVRFSGEE